MRNSLIVAILLLVLFNFNSVAQTVHPWTEENVREIAKSAPEAQLVNTCSMLTQEGYLYYADILSDRLLELKPKSPNYNYRKGFLILQLRRDYLAALPHFEVAVTDIDPNYDMYSPKEMSAPTDAYYHMGQCYHYNYQFDKAKANYEKFLKSTRNKSELIPQAELRLQQLEVAVRLYNNPVDATIKNLGRPINSEHPEYSSVISFDGSAIYFTSRRPWEDHLADPYIEKQTNIYQEDVYVSYIGPDSLWTFPERLQFSTPNRNEATIAVSTDERRIYLYQDQTGGGDIYFSDFYNNRFNEIQHVDNKDINSPYWEAHLFVSPDGSILIFASDRPGGYGGRDLYISRKVNEKWTTPVNMGPNINGPMDEDAPFISVDNRQLYFGTNDSRSMGGFDILLSEMQDDGTFGVAKNIGYPFNSTNDDLYYTTTVDGYTGYLTSYRGDGYGEKDLYEIKNTFLGVKSSVILKGNVVSTTGELLPDDLIFMAKIKCHDCDRGPINHIMYTRKRDGRFMTTLQPCKTYTLYYHDANDDKLMGEETFTTECVDEYQEIYKKLVIDVESREVVWPKDPNSKLPDVVVVDYKNLELKHYFDYNKNKVSPSKGDLKHFMKEIKKQIQGGRERVVITIESSASFVPTKTFSSNEELSRLRGENIKYDLLDYFEKDETTRGRVVITIVKSEVQGPEYEQDAKNKKKYMPFQYVYLKTE